MVTPAPDARATRGLVAAAALCAVVVLASQLAGKAARDAIFLQRFAVTNLPLLLAVSSALSIGFTIVFARRLRQGIPVRVVQLANVISAMLMLVEWQLLPYFPRPVALVVFMHQTLMGPILVSGFWSVVSDCFDPRTARRVLGTIGTGATIGAVVGAVLAERVAAMFGTEYLLPMIAALELLATWRLSRVGRGCAMPTADDAPLLRDAIKNITKVSLLRRLAIVTVIVTISAALLDYVFKAMATEVVRKPDDLARLFALFHGVVGILTALLQWLAGRWALQHLGLARTLASLPGAVIAFGIAAIIAPGIGTYVALRGAENVLRNSLYREAYEVFYTPLLAAERRATKTIIDVGVERFGDVLGGLAVLGIIALAPSATTVLLACAVGLSAVGVIVALQAQHSYVEALERSLLAHSIDFSDDEPRDRTTRATLDLVRSSGGFAAAVDPPPKKPSRWPRFRQRQKVAKPSVDTATRLLTELASNDAKRIRPALEATPLSPSGIAFAITLLDRPDLAEAAMRAISRVATSCIGQLTDAVREGQLSSAIRAQLPAVIVAAAADRARAELARVGLIAGLSDPELDVRCAIAEGLATLREAHPEIAIDEELVFAGVRRELAHAEHTPQTLKHLATLLALALPSEPIQMAFLGLKSEDPTLRGVSLEYLENVLPTDIREQMWMTLSIEVQEAATTARRPLEDVLAELLRSRRDQETLHATQVDLSVARATPRG